MQQDLVDDRGWIRRKTTWKVSPWRNSHRVPLQRSLRYISATFAPGCSELLQLGVAFVLPSFIMVLGLSAAYVRFGGLPWMQGMFYGIGAGVIGIIARSAFKLTKLTLGKDKLLWAVFVLLRGPQRHGPHRKSFGSFCWAE